MVPNQGILCFLDPLTSKQKEKTSEEAITLLGRASGRQWVPPPTSTPLLVQENRVSAEMTGPADCIDPWPSVCGWEA